MYVDTLRLENVRTFRDQEIGFVHPDGGPTNGRDAAGGEQPRLRNVNLLLGDNGSGKTTILQALALAAFGPAAGDANLGLQRLVRIGAKPGVARVRAQLRLHDQDGTPGEVVDSPISVTRRGELEGIEFDGDPKPALWNAVFESDNAAFFIVAYGATRRVEPAENLDLGARTKASFLRAQRVRSIFQDSFSLIPLTYWLPKLQGKERHREVVDLIDRLLEPGRYRFSGVLRDGDYLFERGKTGVPLRSLSDGYRAFLGWVGDLLYHLHVGCPADRPLAESRGIVLVDEIDLHLHPKWQMKVVETVARTFPLLQFVLGPVSKPNPSHTAVDTR